MSDLIFLGKSRCKVNGKIYACAYGKGGTVVDKVEGDGGTPIGSFPLRQVFYRPDRLSTPVTTLPVVPLTPMMGWCDDVADPLYNQLVTLPYAGQHEILWRDDHVYDLIVVVGYNDDPVIAGKGSAIFIHLARENDIRREPKRKDYGLQIQYNFSLTPIKQADCTCESEAENRVKRSKAGKPAFALRRVYPPTAGCLAFSLVDLSEILSTISPESKLIV